MRPSKKKFRAGSRTANQRNKLRGGPTRRRGARLSSVSIQRAPHPYWTVFVTARAGKQLRRFGGSLFVTRKLARETAAFLRQLRIRAAVARWRPREAKRARCQQ